MLYPTINDLLEYGENRYVLVVMASKRARQLLAGSSPKIESKSSKAVGIAVEEIAAGKILCIDNNSEKNEEKTDKESKNEEKLDKE